MLPRQVILLPLCFVFAGCSPMIEIGGAYFPGWLLSAVCGLAAVALTRAFFLLTGLDSFLKPRPLVYPALTVFFVLFIYWWFF